MWTPQVLIAGIVIVGSFVVMVVAIRKYESADECRKVFSALSAIIGVAFRSIVTYFFAQTATASLQVAAQTAQASAQQVTANMETIQAGFENSLGRSESLETALSSAESERLLVERELQATIAQAGDYQSRINDLSTALELATSDSPSAIEDIWQIHAAGQSQEAILLNIYKGLSPAEQQEFEAAIDLASESIDRINPE